MHEHRRHLPHYYPDDAHIFLTFRLYGSLPNLKPELYPTPGHAFLAADRALHANRSGPRWLSDTRIAQMLAAKLENGHGNGRYEISAWVIMPNHVHVLLLPRVELSAITRWLKGTSGYAANRTLDRNGRRFWQDESYDHWVRSEKEFIRIVNYIEANPVGAGLCDRPEDWPYSSARRTGNIACPTPPR